MILRRLRRMTLRDVWNLFGSEFLASAGRAAGTARGRTRKSTAQAADAEYCEVDSLNAPEAVAVLRGWRADVLVVANAPVLRADVFGACRLTALNFHSGRLPEYGGVASEFWALHEGERSAWATLHRVTAALDAGAIHAERPVPIEDADTPASLHAKCIAAGAAALPEVLDRLAEGSEPPLRDPGPAHVRSWPTAAQRRELRRRRTIR